MLLLLLPLLPMEQLLLLQVAPADHPFPHSPVLSSLGPVSKQIQLGAEGAHVLPAAWHFSSACSRGGPTGQGLGGGVWAQVVMAAWSGVREHQLPSGLRAAHPSHLILWRRRKWGCVACWWTHRARELALPMAVVCFPVHCLVYVSTQHTHL